MTQPNRTVMDAALASLAIKAASPDTTLVPVPLETLAAHRRAAAVPPPAPPRVGLKLIAQAGREREAANWIRAAGGFVLSAGPQVLLAELPPDALPRLQACP